MLGVSNWYNPRPKARDVLLNAARVCPYADRATSQNHRSEEIVARSHSRRFSRFALVILAVGLAATTAASFDLSRADDCLNAPNSTAPKGSHWYYHLNRATQQKCWYVRSNEKRPQDVTVQATSASSAMPSTNQIGSTGPRDIDEAVSQSKSVLAAIEDSAFDAVLSTQPAAAVLEAPSSEANSRPTAPTTVIWPDPPPIPPLVKADDAGTATASHDPVYSVAETSDGVSRKDERTSTFDIPIGLFPAFALGLVVLGFGFHFLTKRSAARRAQGNDHEEAVTKPTEDHAEPAGNGLADEVTNVGNDDFESFVLAASGRGPLERIVCSVHSANDIGAREARLAQLRDDIGQRLGWGAGIAIFAARSTETSR
jgi:hypothetical protein